MIITPGPHGDGQQPPGEWPSPLSPRSMAQGISLNDVAWDAATGALVWHEGRGDRGVLVVKAKPGEAPRDLNDEHHIRARVGYGGGDFGAGQGNAFFVSSGRLYRQPLEGGPSRALIPAIGQAAAPAVSPDGRWVLYVYSTERQDGLAFADASGQAWPQKAESEHDFYLQPRWSHDGKQVAWIAWDHPRMPWDGSTLYLADVVPVEGGPPRLSGVRRVAGSEHEAVLQPEFSPDGRYLSFLCDTGGWHQFYLFELASGKVIRGSQEQSAQLGAPAWSQGERTYAWNPDGRSVVIMRNERGIHSLCQLTPETAQMERLAQFEGYTHFSQPAVHPLTGALAVIASSSRQPPRILTLERGAPLPQVVRRARSETLRPADLVAAEPVSWRGDDGVEIHGLLYLPRGARAGAPAIVRIHGGPTGQYRAQYAGETQFLATRGYTVLEVNYRGSTGYGRAYMEALQGQWGVHDVADAVSGARFLAAKGHADAKRLVIMGGSAGGYTVLEALAQHPGLFRAGVCLYGVSNLFTLAMETHKFEERYLDSLIGPLPNSAALYRERSPIFHADRITDPVLVFQGEIDEVVPRSQSDSIVDSLKRRNIPHDYIVFPGEGHGFRKPETVEQFYARLEQFLRLHVLYA